ncbi:MAG: hypothetical protein RL154_1320 [Pseudomonadota bacterium]
MRAQIKQIKTLSNTIVVQISEEKEFLNFLQSHIKKHFETTLFLKKSILIFAKDNEKFKRQAFLSWLGGIFDRSIGLDCARVTPELLKNLHLPINVQIMAKAAIESSAQIFVSCEQNNLIFRHYTKNSPFISFLKTYLKTFNIKEKQFELSIDLSNGSDFQIQTIRKLFSKRIYLAGKQFNLVYNKNALDQFFDAIIEFQEANISSSQDELTDLLEEFGCKEGEDLSRIKRRYFELAKAYHPDKAYGQDESIVQIYVQKFIRIKDVYESICQIYAEQGNMAA